MPPKTKAWAVAGAGAAPAADPFAEVRGADATAPGSTRARNAPSSAAEASVRSFIVAAITDNNLLGLPDAEVQSMAQILLAAKTTKEVFEWCGTLMLGESAAAEIIKRRENSGLHFGQGGAAPLSAAAASKSKAAAAPAAAATSSSSRDAGAGVGGKGAKRAGKGKPLHAHTATGAALVPGVLQECGCFASTHAFKAACLNCGRVICAQEADDFCYYCGLDVSICVAYELKKEQGLITEAAQQRNKQNYERALERRDKLLAFAKERAKRTVVIDDQAGTHSNSAWLTREERDEMREEQRRRVADLHKKTGAYTVHLDIVNQSVSLGCSSAAAAPGAGAVPPDAGAPTTVPVAQLPGAPGSIPACSIPGSIRAPSASATAGKVEGGGDDDGHGSCNGDDGSNDEDEGGPVAARIAPMPTLLQKIWYSPSGARSRPAASPGIDVGEKQPIFRGIAASCRVQNDYFAEDDDVWHEERQRAPAMRSAGARSEDDAPFLTFRVHDVPAAPDDTPSQPTDVFQPLVDHVKAGEQTGPPQTAAAAAAAAIAAAKDDAMCLSMHQPWASLLVAGIKRHEGRSWPTELRGKLWIHAAAAKPSGVEELENYYRRFPWNADRHFPTHYPTSCLLGYVHVTDCLNAEEYKARFAPEEQEESSEYKLICERPKALLFPLQMEGKHKVYKLERKLWMAARKQLGEK